MAARALPATGLPRRRAYLLCTWEPRALSTRLASIARHVRDRQRSGWRPRPGSRVPPRRTRPLTPLELLAISQMAQQLAQYAGHPGRCVGSLVGVMCGDVLGTPIEFSGKTSKQWRQIRKQHPDGIDFPARCRYTDDTQMTIALTKSLIACGCSDAQHATQSYVDERKMLSIRGYGGGARKVLDALARGEVSYLDSGTMVFEGGSNGNGSVMRIAPVGLAYRNVPPGVLREAVRRAIMCTHVSAEAIDAATVQAAAVGMLCKAGVEGGEAGLEPQELVRRLLPLAHTGVLQLKLRRIHKALEELPEASQTEAVRGTVWEGKEGDAEWNIDRQLLDQVVSDRSEKHYYQIRAVDAVASALWAQCRHWGHAKATIQAAVHYGGDTDTIAAIAGALAGAQSGTAWVPKFWWDSLLLDLTHPKSGAAPLVGLAVQLAALDVRE